MATVDKDKVRAFLAKGIPQETVAKMMHCDASYISQLVADPVFSASLQEDAVVESTKRIDQDSTVLSIRGRLLERISSVMEYELNPDRLLKAFAIIDNAKTVSMPHSAASNGATHTVNINLPKSDHINILISNQNQVIEVEGVALVRASTNQIADLVKNYDSTKRDKLCRESTAFKIEDL